jgi:acyl-CoA thioesterase FadM
VSEDRWIESCRGSVFAWEVDHVGHFTVAYYFQRFEDAGLGLLDAVGLGPTYVRASGRGCVTDDCHVRYVHELRGGDIYHVESGVIGEAGEAALVLGHRLIDSATGTLCATVEQRVVHVDLVSRAPRPLTAGQRARVDGRRVRWTEPARERRPRPRGEEGLVAGVRDTVKPWELGILGQAVLTHYIHRFSQSGGHVMAAFGMTPAYQRDELRGLSTFEFQLAVGGPLRAGDVVVVHSALVHVGTSSLCLFHRMADAQTGAELATLHQFGVHLDREARRPAPLPEPLRAKARALLAPTV